MKVSSLATLACAAAGANAAILPNFVGGTKFEETQQVLINNWVHVSSQYSQIVEALDLKKGDVLAKLTQYFSEPFGEIPPDAVKVWQDMFLEFPKQIAQMSFKTPPKKATKNISAFDFHVSDTKFPNHQLRVKSTPEELGIDTVKQYTGYLDVEDEDKHFFYWFFESRNDPKNDPIILWLNGGPGCSSLTGLFFELGPSSITAKLKPEFNPYSWNNNASVIFLDQPVNVGFSYSSQSVTNTVAAGKDVYAFLELFFKQFPEYQKLDFHIAGESYGGHYIPVFSSEILSHPERSFNFKSVLIGNGLTDPLTQYEYYQPMACGEGGEPSVLSPEECDNMAASIPRCTSLIESCYNSGSVWSCVPASIYCNNAQMGPYQKTGRNVYDIRTECKGSSLCYEELQYIDDYLNLPEVRQMLGVEVEAYQGCNFDVNRNFLFAGDWMRPYHKNVVDMLEADLPVLIYAGDKDFICNWLGNQAWVDKLPWSEQEKFEAQPIRDWVVEEKAAGEVKNYKHFTFLRVFGAGHMVPFDQPENSLDMVNRWISGDFVF
ncbi:hypothetical protein METBIDRAFT_32558 [Metschnikowia bicuspidata var. bicuspidata NRRL YB-4993]|uniref:Carboxypeptidase n=1 Tax=Metschnikowia bicuspidata var. bicuspidata NRRL YB-4993 TaxID=869754 RepID=A0A1A0H9L8_9ASCO|nr:hypothetical protein METBIDRAFT_32558 [Metschnikowia bicuspidata var. bicuspidata NRRL YB-4993]OBA20582.1 hypothetical protein METBIDRAFT_32558 [Metschnikowia bicuspidata var. bicuspidata NRRL YB-4993]